MTNTANSKCAVIILAAGNGTRMRSSLPKVLHKIGNAPLIAHVLRTAAALSPERVTLVVAPGMDMVRACASETYPACQFAVQDQQLGTGHAVRMAKEALAGFSGTILIMCGDTPLLRPETLVALCATKNAAVTVLGMRMADPTGYGRLVIEGGNLARIVEQRDAAPEEKAITLCNAGVMAVASEHLFTLLETLGNQNASGEYYLTDLIAAARAQGLNCAVTEAEASEVLGINTRAQLAAAESALQQRLRSRALEQGATLIDPSTIYFSVDTELGQDVIVHPCVVFGPGVRVENGAEIRSFSHIEGAHIGKCCVVGPYARLRPGTVLAAGTHIGNFVEIKKSTIGEGAKINHLSYVGDASVGAHTNIGAGVITCNYDGVNKHTTTIGERAFIGSNAALVAPVTIGAHAVVGAGSVITENVPESALALGRGRQVIKDL